MKRELFAAAVAAAVACNGIAGVRDLTLAPVDAGTDAGDAAPTDAADATADAPDAAPPGCASDTDPANCGECGYACPGTACTAGRCAPTLIATSIAGGRSLILDDTGILYWTAPPDGGVLSVSRSALAATPAAAAPALHAASVATYRAWPGEPPQSGPVIFWTDLPPTTTPSVHRCSTTFGECIPPPEQPLAYVPFVADLACIAQFTVCWTERGDAGAVRCQDNSAGAQPIAVGVRDPVPLAAVPDSGVYFGGADGFGFCPTQGCAGPPAMQKTTTPVVAMAVDPDGWLYYATAAGDVLRVAISPAGPTGAPQPIAPTQGTVTAISTSDLRVYWTALGAGAADGRVMAFTKKDGRTRALAAEQHGPRGVRADDLRVFWLTSGEDIGHSDVWSLPR